MQPSSYKTRTGKRLCDPTGWWWSEKLDGMKARWIKGRLITRNGISIDAPQWFLDSLPNVDVEGELYFGRGKFHKTGGLRAHRSSSSWKRVEFHVFDLVDYGLTFAERQVKLTEYKKLKLVKWYEIKSTSHLEEEFKNIVETGGEGVIIADPWGLYEDGRVEQILKYKALKDCEAVVIGYETDESGDRLASFRVHPLREHNKKPNKKITFKIGTGLKIRHRYNFKKRFPIGTVVSYTYEVMGKNGKPRTPVYKGIRTDITCP